MKPGDKTPLQQKSAKIAVGHPVNSEWPVAGWRIPHLEE